MSNEKKWLLAGIILVSFIIGQFYGKSVKKCLIPAAQRADTKNDSSLTTQKASPTPELGKVEVKSHSQKLEKYGGAKVVGEVVNNTENPASSIKVTATFYDKDDAVLGSDFSYAGETSDTPLEVGKTTPFEVNTYPDNFVPDHYKLDVSWR